MNYSIHTYELLGEFKFKDWRKVCKKVRKNFPSVQSNIPENKEGKYKEEYIYRRGNLPGITSITLSKTCTENSVFRCFIYVRVNPYNSLTNRLHSDGEIIDAKDIARSLKITNEYLQFLPKQILETLTLNRVDFCVNLKFSNQVAAKEYLHLISMGLPRKCMSRNENFNQINIHENLNESSYLLTCNSYAFEVYLKSDQMQNHMYLSNPADYYGTIRFELRDSHTKLEQLSFKYNKYFWEGNYDDFLIAAPSIAENEIKKFVGEMVGYGDFYQYSHTKIPLENSNIDIRPKKHARLIISKLAMNYNAQDISSHYKITRKRWKTLLEHLNRLGISPISVPKSFSCNFYPGVNNWDNYFSSPKNDVRAQSPLHQKT